jgi:hypothetical protein
MNIFQGSLTQKWTKLVKSFGHQNGPNTKRGISNQNTLGNRITVPGGHFDPISSPF